MSVRLVRWFGVVLLALAGCDGGEEFVDAGAGDAARDVAAAADLAATGDLPAVIDVFTPAQCGNGQQNPGEQCDGADLAGASCASIGAGSGQLGCTASCTYDTSGCTPPTTGKNFGEKCGGAFGGCVAGLTCVLFNQTGSGTGYCTKSCSAQQPCPSAPPGAECAFETQGGNTICGFVCSASNKSCPAGLNCNYNASGQFFYCTTDPAPVCGDGKIDALEECDTGNLNGATCAQFGYSGGALKCTSGCKLDKSSCTGAAACGNVPARDCAGGTAFCGALLPFTPVLGDGYEVTHAPQHSYLRRDTQMLVKYAAASVACLAPGSSPLGLGDMSMADGSTPKTAGGQLRHPASTHDFGRDIDMAYFQVNQPNNDLRPVCTHISGGQDQYHCVGAPQYLDVARTTLFVAKLLESPRVRVIGVDGQVGPLLQQQAQLLYSQGKLTQAVLQRFSGALAFETVDNGLGWYHFHHHHLHLSTHTTPYAAAPSLDLPPPLPPGFMPPRDWPVELDSAELPTRLQALEALDPAIKRYLYQAGYSHLR